MRALSIRQPYVELILRGIKTIELRSKPTKIIGERFFIYSSKKMGDIDGFPLVRAKPGELPTGLIVATAIISRVIKYGPNDYGWCLEEVQRLEKPFKPKGCPQPSWFSPE